MLSSHRKQSSEQVEFAIKTNNPLRLADIPFDDLHKAPMETSSIDLLSKSQCWWAHGVERKPTKSVTRPLGAQYHIQGQNTNRKKLRKLLPTTITHQIRETRQGKPPDWEDQPETEAKLRKKR